MFTCTILTGIHDQSAILTAYKFQVAQGWYCRLAMILASTLEAAH